MCTNEYKNYGGLVHVGIKVISCAHDRMAVERRVQAKVIENYERDKITFKIKHPASQDDIVIDAVVVQNQLLMMVQDSKHALVMDQA